MTKSVYAFLGRLAFVSIITLFYFGPIESAHAGPCNPNIENCNK